MLKHYYLFIIYGWLCFYSNIPQPQIPYFFADAHYSGFASELVDDKFSEVSTTTIAELKEYFNNGGRLLGIAFTIPDHYPGNDINLYESSFIKMYELYIKMIEDNDDFLCSFNRFEKLDIQKLNLFITIEGISKSVLDQILYLDSGKNIRIVGLIHNSNNEFGSSSSISQNQNDSGLTELGKSTIVNLISHKIIIDVSHFSSKSFQDAIEICNNLNGKIIASHSGVSSIKSHPRNLSNEQLKALKKIGGGIGLIIHQPFINANTTKKTTIADYLKMLELLQTDLNMQNIFIGSDYCKEINPIQGVRSLADLPKEILRHYGTEISGIKIQDFTFNNLLTVLKN